MNIIGGPLHFKIACEYNEIYNFQNTNSKYIYKKKQTKTAQSSCTFI